MFTEKHKPSLLENVVIGSVLKRFNAHFDVKAPEVEVSQRGAVL